MSAIGTNISNIRQVPATAEAGTRVQRGDVADRAFREQLTALQNALPTAAKAQGVAPLKFSNHAIDRMQARGIRFTGEEMAKIEGAVSKAASKGAKETLLLTDNSALIVSVRDNT